MPTNPRKITRIDTCKQITHIVLMTWVVGCLYLLAFNIVHPSPSFLLGRTVGHVYLVTCQAHASVLAVLNGYGFAVFLLIGFGK
ncbi:Uncharacterised protein [Segatella copri]|nr:Uncharacterised protein [Segatella copri]